MRSDAALGPADHPFDGLQVTSCGCRGALAEHQKRLSSITRCPRRQNLSAELVPCQRHFHSRASARSHHTASGRRVAGAGRRRARAAPAKPCAPAREPGGRGVTAWPRAWPRLRARCVRTREKPVREARFETPLTVGAEARATTARCRADETRTRRDRPAARAWLIFSRMARSPFMR